MLDLGKNVGLFLGDSLEVLRGLPDSSVDAVVTDPPYGLSSHSLEDVRACLLSWLNGDKYEGKGVGFMGYKWDSWVPSPVLWGECLRVLKPGGHILAFAGTRSFDLMSLSLRLAGFELRDSIGYASSGEEAPLLAWVRGDGFPKSHNVALATKREFGVEDASLEGWGTALKPAWEPIMLARKPLEGTVAENVRKWGTGGLNVGGCAVVGDDGNRARFPANVIHDGSEVVTDLFPMQKSGGMKPHQSNSIASECVASFVSGMDGCIRTYDCTPSQGSASRFFYCAKASQRDREYGLSARGGGKLEKSNVHPTVKPIELMRYLCRLVTPKGGVVLDPFMGSGTTGIGAVLEGFGFRGVELSSEYFDISSKRIGFSLESLPSLF